MDKEKGRYRKIGYARLVDGQHRVIANVSLEELLLNRRTFANLYSAKSYYRGKLYCCCHEKDTADIELTKDGFRFPDADRHSDDCLSYFSDMLSSYKICAFSGSFDKEPLRVSFDWRQKASAALSVIRRESLYTLLDKASLDLASFVTYLNLRAFSYRLGNEESPILKNEISHSRLVADLICKNDLCNRKIKDILQTKTDFLYRPNMEPGMKRLYYGKISGLATKYANENSPYRNVFLSSMILDGEKEVLGRYGSGPMVRFRKKDFDPLYDSLFDKSSIYICGFITAREVLADTSDKPLFTMPINPNSTAPSQANTEVFKPMRLVYEMKCGCLFNCNDAGMIVFSKEELVASNAALAEGKRLYRPVFGMPDGASYSSRFPILISSENYYDEELSY